jgi:primosomal protein N''
MPVAQELKVSQKDRDLLVQCLAEAHESLRLLAGVDENGPALVWLAEHLLHAARRSEEPS